MHDFAIVGGGILGLSTGMALTRRYPDARILLLEKESSWGYHQSGHNSGVIHSGIYYQPGTYKAKFARAASRSIPKFCEENSIKYEMCGKLVVARNKRELFLLDELRQRAAANGLNVRKLGPDQIKEIEPYVSVPGALHVADAGIVNYQRICERFAEIVAENGGELRLNTKVEALSIFDSAVRITTNQGTFEARFLITCAGLHCDHLAQMENLGKDVRIIPFRGDYYSLKPHRRYLVKNLVYPVPNPKYPFLGVHLVRKTSGEVHIGPNAAPNFTREGYNKEFSMREFREIICYPGFWRLGAKFWREGLQEAWRSLNKGAFVKATQRFVPEIQEEDLDPAPTGIRAQTVTINGSMVDDFVFVDGRRSVHVLNAPSPAATCSIEIGNAVVERIAQRVTR